MLTAGQLVRVVKIGGSALLDAAWLHTFAVAAAGSRTPLVIVHGGGPEISDLSARLNVPVSWHEGRRITTPEGLDVAAMVLNGTVNKRLVGALLAAGVDALGISGIDGGLLRADVAEGGALGRVGRVVHVRTALLRNLLSLGITPVVSPVSSDGCGGMLNVNADDAAAAVAAALGALDLTFVTDVEGVRDAEGVRSMLGADEAAALVGSGIASGGMRVKVNAALSALAGGVTRVRIGSADVLHDDDAGTLVTALTAGVA